MKPNPTEQIKELLNLNTFELRFKVFMEKCQAIVDADKLSKNLNYYLEAEEGRRYIRIWSCGGGSSNHRSAWAFVDKTNGDVLKPATWKAPAKHARGNIYDADYGTGKIGAYGPAYLK